MGHLSNESSARDPSASATDLDPDHVHVDEGAHETAIGRLSVYDDYPICDGILTASDRLLLCLSQLRRLG